MLSSSTKKTNKQEKRHTLFSLALISIWSGINWLTIIVYDFRLSLIFVMLNSTGDWKILRVIKEQSVFNAVNLSLFMVNVSQAMLTISDSKSILDLKAHYHGLRYVQEVFKILPKNTKPINIMQRFDMIPVLGRIHSEKLAA